MFVAYPPPHLLKIGRIDFTLSPPPFFFLQAVGIIKILVGGALQLRGK